MCKNSSRIIANLTLLAAMVRIRKKLNALICGGFQALIPDDTNFMQTFEWLMKIHPKLIINSTITQ